MPLPPLKNWETTRDSLHQAARAIGSIKVAVSPKQPNSTQYSLSPTRYGLKTNQLSIGEIQLHYAEAMVKIKQSDGSIAEIPLAGHHQVSFTDTVLEKLAEAGHKVEPNREILPHTTPFNIDPNTAAAFLDLHDRMYTVLARFRAKLGGCLNAVLVWPHHFDMAFLWFKEGCDEHKDPHIGIGFAPFSDNISRPYFYFYAWPMDEDFAPPALPKPAYWESTDYKGIRVDYDDLLNYKDSAIEDMLLDLFVALFNAWT